MASSKQKLQGLLGAQAPIQKGTPYTVSDGADAVPVPLETAAMQRGAPFTVSTSDTTEGPLPSAVLELRVELREIARSYIGARRRSGRALLEAARWLSEARATSEHGEWYDFLAATETTADTAERLLRIYDLAIQHPAFAAAVADGRLNQSAAERLARGTTPSEVIDVVLTAESPPSVADVNRAIRAARRPTESDVVAARSGQIPQIAGFGAAGSEQIPQIAGFGASASDDPQILAALREVADILANLALQADRVPADENTERTLKVIEQALNTFRSALAAR